MKGALLALADSSPLRAPGDVLPTLGRTVFVAPHPDDETLGAGGLLAGLNRRSGPGSCHVLLVSDGAASHPHSRRFPAPTLRALRESETLAAISALGLADPAAAVTFLGLPDGAVPGTPAAPGFTHAVERVRSTLQRLAAETLLVPWRRDPHPDHRATAVLVRQALAGLRSAPRIIEYPVWLWERPEPDDLPRADEVSAWRLDIRDLRPAKQAAIAAHRSQTSDLIDDDPTGFRLSPVTLAHFEQPWELFFDPFVPAGAAVENLAPLAGQEAPPGLESVEKVELSPVRRD